MTLSGVRRSVHRSPFVVGALCAVVEILHLEEALGIVLVCSTLAEVVAVVGHERVLAILLVDDVLQHSESVAILVALHKGTGVIAGCGTACGATLCPLAALFA